MSIEFKDFKNYWFTHDGTILKIYDKNQLSTPMLEVPIADVDSEIDNPDILEDLALYRTRPEWLVGQTLDTLIDFSAPGNNSVTTLKDVYKSLLTGTLCLRAFQSIKDVSQGEKVAEKIIHYLEFTDFFEAPASTRYHEATPSGLLFHSLKVYNEAATLQNIPAFKNCNICKWSLVALVHDWCKIGLYEGYIRNVKNEMTGQWEKVPSYKVATVKQNNTLGHGAASMFMISQFVKLSLEEALAIRWHMGVWNVCESEMNDLQDSNETYPLVHMLQFADQLAITKYESARYMREKRLAN